MISIDGRPYARGQRRKKPRGRRAKRESAWKWRLLLELLRSRRARALVTLDQLRAYVVSQIKREGLKPKRVLRDVTSHPDRGAVQIVFREPVPMPFVEHLMFALDLRTPVGIVVEVVLAGEIKSVHVEPRFVRTEAASAGDRRLLTTSGRKRMTS